MSQVLEDLLQGNDLSVSEAESLLHELAGGELDPATAGAILVALRAKGETPGEVQGFARAMRALATNPGIDVSGAVDVVGTGGDRSGSLNLSTGSALLAAAAGVPVVKHGNRSMTSASGSADVLEQLGLPMPLDSEQARDLFDRIKFTFLFAPHYHPAMAAVGPIRRALGVRTVFNILGPLTNPAGPPCMVIGAFDPNVARLMAEALTGLDIERAFVVHGAAGWDEPSPLGEFLLLDVTPGRVVEATRSPSDLGIEICEPAALAGGDPEHNARRIIDVFEGEPGPHRDALVLGAALAMEVGGRAESAESAVAAVSAAIDDGRALSLVKGLTEPGPDQGDR